MFALLVPPLASALVLNHPPLSLVGRHHAARVHVPLMQHGGKGFGGGEATRDPAPTLIDPNDPKGKQQAIHKAESFAEYLARRDGAGAAASVATPAPTVAPAASTCPAHITAAPATRARRADRHVSCVSTRMPSKTDLDYLGNTEVQGAHPPLQEPVLTKAYLAAVRRELLHVMDNPSWDDGSLAPIFIRLAWHSSGTYDKESGTGGSNGAGMRFETEAADPENAGLAVARAFLEPIKRRFPAMSYSDLWILAAYAGIEHTGGPIIEFTPGRKDHLDESYWSSMSYDRLPAAEKYLCPHVQGSLGEGVDVEGRVKGWEGLCTHVREEVFYRMGFNDQEIVALLCGGHVYGRCHPSASGYAGPWVEHPTVFSNEYATDMLEDEWRLVDHSDTWLDAVGAAELRPAPGKRQYVNQKPGEAEEDEPNQMMLPSDMILAWDPTFRAQLQAYAADEALLELDFGDAFKKLTELGCGFA
uniref:Plant heme peroxidase family profile domain-containing protein n=1 Tax=Coccolithus braarudii TaxID=221442 RepID=A0A7S0L925_9EUKA|eukprot:CAMPEP_0183359094 /NCGR_PEP_ID=MMETSP0164_2-20130417/51185_1 /TAXON_ID=221442 /ORGANISM="Coccolithus pelagicus ssp braarudi, Strain PLY182g" /LENGTH=472 /DNA_ID=CAMNT_0025533129 /DNA_START=57 /DNA_END=1475 /DNA_ORIENTATION=+